MSQMRLLRLFISERLHVAAEEIFAAVQRTITEHEEEEEEEEADGSDQDSDQHGLTHEVHSHSKDSPQVFVCAYEQEHFGQEWSPESCHNNPGVGQEDCGLLLTEPAAIKQEQPWSSPEDQQLSDTEDSESSTSKVSPTCVKSFIYSDITKLQTHDTGNEDTEPVPNTSADHREVEGQSSSECWTVLPDCSLTLDNTGLTGYSVGKVQTQRHMERNRRTRSCKPRCPTPPNKDTNRRTRSYCCRVCGKEFSHSAHLAAHTQTHTGEKLFVCEVCGKEFRHGNSVSVHMRIHTEEKPYRCRICGKQFRHVGNLNVHMRIHTGEKPYACTVCGKKFSRNNLMTKHMAVHTGEISLSVKSVLRKDSVGMTS